MYGNGTAPFHGVFGLKLHGSFTPEQLTQALARLQAKYPLLNTVVQRDKRGTPWFVTSLQPAPIPVRIVPRNSEDAWIQETHAEWAIPFKPQSEPLLRIVWLRADDVSDLLLTVHHCAFDGGSVLTLVNDLLLVLDEPVKDIGPCSTPPFEQVRDLIPHAIYSNAKNRMKRLALQGVAQLAAATLVVAKALHKHSPITNREDYLITWKIDKDTSSALLRRCTQRRVTTHAALSAAFLLAFQQIKGTQARNKVLCPVDIRRYVKEIKKDTLFAFGMGVNLSIEKATGKNFWEVAVDVQADLTKQSNKLNGYHYLMNFECFHPILTRVSQKQEKEKVNYDLVFSNLGRLDIPKSFSKFEVAAVYPSTVMGPTGNYNTVLTNTFRGEMSFSFTGSTHHFTYKEAMAVKNIAMALLLQEELAQMPVN
ncbi:condensation domain protein [Filimonas lacunae]|nr:condensation domain protein [Filimonas lacunae]